MGFLNPIPFPPLFLISPHVLHCCLDQKARLSTFILFPESAGVYVFWESRVSLYHPVLSLTHSRISLWGLFTELQIFLIAYNNKSSQVCHCPVLKLLLGFWEFFLTETSQMKVSFFCLRLFGLHYKILWIWGLYIIDIKF